MIQYHVANKQLPAALLQFKICLFDKVLSYDTIIIFMGTMLES